MDENSRNATYTFPVKELQQRHGISRFVVYERLMTLHIKAIKRGNKCYISPEQVQLMDDLCNYLKNKGTKNEFVQQCIASGRIALPQTEAIVMQAEIEVVEAELIDVHQANEVPVPPAFNTQYRIESLKAQKKAGEDEEDLQQVDEKAQYSAAKSEIAHETLTLTCRTKKNFTVSKVKEKVEQHKRRCKEPRSFETMAAGHDDFLSQKLAL